MSNPAQHLSSAPAAPFGQESVLSTRSLSYMSADSLGSPAFQPAQSGHARNISTTNARLSTRRSTMSSDSEYGLEMAETRDRELKDIPELPESVAESPLFTLPREIRDRIYSFCLTSQNGRQVEWPTAWKSYTLQPQLLRTCEIVYNEAAQLLYTVNTLIFHHPSDANMFVRAISSPLWSRHIANVSLHIRAQDTRLWMPYLTSKETNRSLKADFPNLRDLSIRFRSNKWQNTLPPESNLKIWAEDSRLDEIIDGLREVFLPGYSQNDDSSNTPKDDREFETWLSNHSSQFPLNPEDPGYRKQWLEIHKARALFTAKRASTAAPTIRVICACRVQAAHFNALTTAPMLPPQPPRDLARADNGTGVIQQQSDDIFAPPPPVQDGEPFRGFSAVDLRSGMKRLHDPDLGSANVARTPFGDKGGVLLALEIHCLDPKRGDGGPTHYGGHGGA